MSSCRAAAARRAVPRARTAPDRRRSCTRRSPVARSRYAQIGTQTARRRAPAVLSASRAAPLRRTRWSRRFIPEAFQERLDERIEIAIHHFVDIAHLQLGAMIVHHRVRLEDVGADLIAPRDVRLLLVNFRLLRVAL